MNARVSPKPPASAREVAFLALCEESYIDESIFELGRNLTSQDRDFAYCLAQGVARRWITLRYFLAMLEKRIDLKRKEQILLLMALYQYLFMDRVPIYAIVDETMKLIKKYGKREQAAFCHALLRKFSKVHFSLPTGKDARSLSLVYSYPVYFIERVLEEYGMERGLRLFETGNTIFAPMARVLDPSCLEGAEVVMKNHFNVIRVPSKEKLLEMAKDARYYIQNATPLFLLDALAKTVQRPLSILDLCAAPGGKLLALRDLYKEATLFANDSSQERGKLLEENLHKYRVGAALFSSPGQTLETDKRFDLIVLDVPCSNSGVLHKRSDARNRLDETHLRGLEELQWQLLSNAVTLLNPGGVIWYMTCSILLSENESLVERAKAELPLRQIGKSIKQLPNQEGWDGGFGVAFYLDTLK